VTSDVKQNLNKTRKGRAESATSTERESLASEERHVPEKEIYPITEPTEYSPTDIKEEPASCDEGNLTDSDMYEPPEHTQAEYPSTDIKEESPTYGEGNLTDSDIYEPPEHTQMENTPGNGGEYVKSNPNPVEINHSESLIESRKPDHRIYYTDPITQNSVYKGHSAPSSETGKDSYSDSDLTEEHRFSLKPFNCTECGKCFFHASSLTRHKMIHTGEKPFKCPECGKSFNNALRFARHTRIHTGEKPFKCTECGKCFNHASQIAIHKRIHTGEKPFKCTVCGKCFSQTANLRTHKLIHAGEKTFKCTECEKCFTHASYLAAHKSKSHTGVRPFKYVISEHIQQKTTMQIEGAHT
uniref:C2H2-type domain-containing protein n=1 Tax=Leptobrachium leishanense TaxID=445787 RepID=A0A8C5Q3W0_9ANUR